MVSDTVYFSHLYEIAAALNKEFTLHAALKKALERTVHLFELETAWVWLMQEDMSVYLAASYNLPPALRDHPERLSGTCYCIQKYLSDNINEPQNISEVTCSRLKNVVAGTLGLKFHATVPITISNTKAGLINIVSRESQKLTEKQLSVLATISELVGIAIQRTRLYDAYRTETHHTETALRTMVGNVMQPRLQEVIRNLEDARAATTGKNNAQALKTINNALREAEQLKDEVEHVASELTAKNYKEPAPAKLTYPASPLSPRELEILSLVRTGLTNKEIGQNLFIAERTVKFHVTSILEKLNASTRTEAVDVALRRGLIGNSEL